MTRTRPSSGRPSRRPARIDLHTHSRFSDGSLTPAELVARALSVGTRLLALTDHDTVAGLGPFFEALARTPGVEGIGGIEISAIHLTASGQPAHAHLLGYGLGADVSESLRARLVDYQESREERGRAIVCRLRELGIAIDDTLARAAAGGEVWGRPHIAAALVGLGVAADLPAAFRDYLSVGAPAYVERDRPSAPEATRFLREQRLVPVLAHPPAMQMDEDALDALIGRLRDDGLMGLEGYYPSYNAADTALCRRLADRHGLLLTGGSDFHGDAKSGIELGIGYGNLRVPPAAAERLKKAIICLQS